MPGRLSWIPLKKSIEDVNQVAKDGELILDNSKGDVLVKVPEGAYNSRTLENKRRLDDLYDFLETKKINLKSDLIIEQNDTTNNFDFQSSNTILFQNFDGSNKSLELLTSGDAIFHNNLDVKNDLIVRNVIHNPDTGEDVIIDDSLTVNEDVTINNVLDVQNKIINTVSEEDVVIDDSLTINNSTDILDTLHTTGTITGDVSVITPIIDVTNEIKNSSGDVKVNDNLHVTGTSNLDDKLTVDNTIEVPELYVTDNINNNGNTVLVSDSLHVTGTTDLDSELTVPTIDVNTEIHNSDTDESVKINDSLHVTGTTDMDDVLTVANTVNVPTLNVTSQISNDTGSVYINDSLDIENSTNINDTLTVTNTITGNTSVVTPIIDVNNYIQNTDSGESVKINDDLHVTGSTEMEEKLVNSTSIQVPILDVNNYIHNTDTDKDVIIDDNLTVNNNLNVNGSTHNINGELTVDTLRINQVTSNPTTNNGGDLTLDDNVSVTKNMTVEGNLTVNGDYVESNTETLTVNDNTIVLNDGETADGVSDTTSGLTIDRGTLDNYDILFDENSDDLKIGIRGSLQKVATREDSPNDTGIPFWNDSIERFDTDNNFVYDNSNNRVGINKTPGVDLDVSGTIRTNDRIEIDKDAGTHLEILENGNNRFLLDYAYSDNSIEFETVNSSGNYENRIVIMGEQDTTQVGIDNSSPSYTLDVAGRIRTTSDIGFDVDSNQLRFDDEFSTDKGQIKKFNDGTDDWLEIEGYKDTSTDSKRRLRFGNDISNFTGKVGVQTNNPEYTLDLIGDIHVNDGGRLNGVYTFDNETRALTWDLDTSTSSDDWGSLYFTDTNEDNIAWERNASNNSALQVLNRDNSNSLFRVRDHGDIEAKYGDLIGDTFTIDLDAGSSPKKITSNSVEGAATMELQTNNDNLSRLSSRIVLRGDGNHNIEFYDDDENEFVTFDGVNNKVGIGETSPDAKLDVNGEIVNDEGIFIDRNVGSNPDISLAIGDSDTGFDWNSDGIIDIYANNDKIGQFDKSRFDFDRELRLLGSDNSLYITEGGNHISNDPSIRINSNSMMLNAADNNTLYLNRDTTADTKIQRDETTTAHFDDGKVGINKEDPTEEVDVDGTVKSKSNKYDDSSGTSKYEVAYNEDTNSLDFNYIA